MIGLYEQRTGMQIIRCKDIPQQTLPLADDFQPEFPTMARFV